MDQRVCGEFYSHEVVRRFCILPVGSGMVLDVQLLAVNQDPQVTEVLVVIAFKRHTILPLDSASCTTGTRIVGVPLCVSFATAWPPLPEIRNGVSRPPTRLVKR